MKALKFRVHSQEHSKAIQTILFELGYEWNISGKNHSFITKPFIYCGEDCSIRFGTTESTFKEYLHKETTLDDLYKDDREVLTIEEAEQRFNIKLKLN